jgi:hypothetical protein
MKEDEETQPALFICILCKEHTNNSAYVHELSALVELPGSSFLTENKFLSGNKVGLGEFSHKHDRNM